MFIIDNQLVLLLSTFLAGAIATGFLLRRPAGNRAWLIADLVWVLLGGVGAVGAVLAGIYKADSGALDRRIEVAYAATAAFDRDSARFRLSYCEAPDGVQVVLLCDKADFLSASTAENADLPLFIALTSNAGPLQSLNLFGSSRDNVEMIRKARDFDTRRFLVFTSRDAETVAALSELRATEPRVVADFTVLADSYDALIDQVTQLRAEWEILQRNIFILVIQIISLCLVSFAAPFRLGKSIVELRDR